MLVGEYYYAIDNKGRLAIPPKFREHLGKEAVVSRGLERCLWVYPRKEWEVWAEKLMKLPLAQANTRAFIRLMMAGAHHVVIDGQGRILIPEPLRKYALQGKQVAVIGLYNRIELWDAEMWREYQERTEEESGDIAEKLGSLGLGI
jgi:MraZ protein